MIRRLYSRGRLQFVLQEVQPSSVARMCDIMGAAFVASKVSSNVGSSSRTSLHHQPTSAVQQPPEASPCIRQESGTEFCSNPTRCEINHEFDHFIYLDSTLSIR